MQNSVSQSNTAVVIHQPTCLPANAATNTKISPKMRGEESIKTKPSTHPGSKSSALSQCGKQLKALGPKSLAGKKKSARNAFKSGFYSKALLPWEDPKAQQTQWDALVAQWGAYDPTRVGLLHTYTFALLQQQRLMVIERDKIIGAMQSVDFAIEFCKRAGLPLTSFSALPVWFFHPDDDHEKTRALEVARIYEQATMLKESFSDRVVPQIQSQYPDLYRYVMRNQPVSHSFLIALGQQYRQQTPILNLGGLLNSLQQQYAKHLIWAEDPRRYQLIIDGLRAELIERIIDMDKSFARAAAIQNRMLKSLSGLAAVDQHEAQWPGRQAAGELDCEAQPSMIDASDMDLPNPQESDDEPDVEGDPTK